MQPEPLSLHDDQKAMVGINCGDEKEEPPAESGPTVKVSSKSRQSLVKVATKCEGGRCVPSCRARRIQSLSSCSTTTPSASYLYVCMYVCMCVGCLSLALVDAPALGECTYIHTYTHTYTHTYMHACMHTCIHACVHTCMHAATCSGRAHACRPHTFH